MNQELDSDQSETSAHENHREITFLLLHRRADVSVLVSADGIDDLIMATHLNFDDRVFELRHTHVYRCRQTAVGSVSASVVAQLLHARQQCLHLETHAR